MAQITINTFDETTFVRTEASNDYTVFVPGIVKKLPTAVTDVYATITVQSQLDEYYDSTKSSAESNTYNYVRGLLAKGYTVLFRPITGEQGSPVTTIAAAISALAGGTTQMAISDKFLYKVDFLTDGGLCENINEETISTLASDYEKVYKNLQGVAAARGDCLVIPGLYDGLAMANATGVLKSLIDAKYITAPYGPSFDIKIQGEYHRMDGAFIFLVTLANSIKSTNIWYPPAGVSRMIVADGVRNPDYEISGATLSEWQKDEYTKDTHPVNPIMNIPNYGYTIFGQRTMVVSKDPGTDQVSAFKNINTAIVANVIRRAIFDIGIGLTFEQNETTTWTLFKTRLGDKLEAIRDDRGITDYRIIMDDTTTTAADLAANTLRGKVYISVVSVVENILIDFYIEPQSVTFTE